MVHAACNSATNTKAAINPMTVYNRTSDRLKNDLPASSDSMLSVRKDKNQNEHINFANLLEKCDVICYSLSIVRKYK